MKKRLFLLAVALPSFVFSAYGNKMNVIPETSGAGQEVSNNTGKTNGHAWVDLGLPSGIKWATCNVGASYPEGYGYYYAWGETKPKNDYDYYNYKWFDGSPVYKFKYCGDYCCYENFFRFQDNKHTLDPEDDAAHVNWGGAWRMPTKEDQEELHQKCTWTWTTRKGVNGYKVTGPNGNSIFLPAAGYRVQQANYLGSYGFYLSSSVDASYGYRDAYILWFDDRWHRWNSERRYFGQSVRPVCK